MKYKLKEKVWLYPGEAAWHFVTINKKISKEIKEKVGKSTRGFGSIRIKATIGKTSWDTSIFPSKESVYLLPLKSLVRRKEGLMEGDTVNLTIEIKS